MRESKIAEKDKVKTRACDVRGKVCIATDKQGKKWKYVAHNEGEADLMAEAVEERGWVTPIYWSRV